MNFFLFADVACLKLFVPGIQVFTRRLLSVKPSRKHERRQRSIAFEMLGGWGPQRFFFLAGGSDGTPLQVSDAVTRREEQLAKAKDGEHVHENLGRTGGMGERWKGTLN